MCRGNGELTDRRPDLPTAFPINPDTSWSRNQCLFVHHYVEPRRHFFAAYIVQLGYALNRRPRLHAGQLNVVLALHQSAIR